MNSNLSRLEILRFKMRIMHTDSNLFSFYNAIFKDINQQCASIKQVTFDYKQVVSILSLHYEVPHYKVCFSFSTRNAGSLHIQHVSWNEQLSVFSTVYMKYMLCNQLLWQALSCFTYHIISVFGGSAVMSLTGRRRYNSHIYPAHRN